MMKDLKRLPRNVQSSLRSSVFLFDLPRVVEELIFNSVDAGATKVFISLSVGACYIKVEDDGYGITRDGLVLLGEKHATSKFHLPPDFATSAENFGFRGEALGSLSDVSLVEIRTKARGKPNSYCKIIKGWKCLYLGIDDQRDSVGTTVIVRDLFCNQPVRRKNIQSSPKKVLHSLKKCVLQTALVNPGISFKVIDIETEGELLHTIPSTSPLHLVSDVFGEEVSNSMHEILFSDQVFKLSGYISGPTDAFSTKTFQYVYINSRFVCNGPIHNLLNSLAANLQSSKVEAKFQGGKRPRVQAYPAFMLNLSCPLSSYDLTFEPSKTIIEFKDWAVVLLFFKQAVWNLWKGLVAQSLEGEIFSHGDVLLTKSASRSCAMRKRKHLVQSTVSSPTCNLTTEATEDSKLSCTQRTQTSDVEKLFPQLITCQSNSGRAHQEFCFHQDQIDDKEDSFSITEDLLGFDNGCNELVSPYSNCSFIKDPIFSHQPLKVGENFEVRLRDNPYVDDTDRSATRRLSRSIDNYDFFSVDNNNKDACVLAYNVGSSKLDLRVHRWMDYKQCNSGFHKNQSAVKFESCHRCIPPYDFVDVSGAGYDTDISKFGLSSLMQNANASACSFSVLRKCQTTRELDASPNGFFNQPPLAYASVTKDNSFFNVSTAQLLGSSSSNVYSETDIGSPHSVSSRLFKCNDDSTYMDTSGEIKSCGNDSGIAEVKAATFKNVLDCSHGSLASLSIEESGLDHSDYFSLKKKLYHADLSEPSDVFFRSKLNDTDWLLSDSSEVGYVNKDTGVFDGPFKKHHSRAKRKQVKQDNLHCQLSRGCPFGNSRRSHSAPPFYKGKHKFSILNDYQTAVEEKEHILHGNQAWTRPETISSICDTSLPCLRECIGENPATSMMVGVLDSGQPQNVQSNHMPVNNVVEGTDEMEYGSSNLVKWRKGSSLSREGGDMSNFCHDNQDDVLDISSGLLHLAGSSLVPESISRECLDKTRVLLQVDKKFIPVMADETLVIIDQHAADERIRLEELRRKVISGEGNSVTYLDHEQDLVIPGMGLQILQTYTDQIQRWGWICNIQTEYSESFSKTTDFMKKQQHGVTLVAVPCILGISLTDKDLVEYLDQLAETDGSSSLPPSVVRVLNFKACRGAIMFGDSLLPSESSLIVEELKATSLCFQCAHGRPTAIPLLNVASLHEQLAILDKGIGGTGSTWHGLHRQIPSIERARQRLASVKRFQSG